METINDALIECVKALGGSKQVGPRIWPEKTPEGAQRLLLDCLNPDRPQHLTPEQVQFVLGLARAVGCHAGMQFLAASLSYAEPTPVEPEDERVQLQREFIEATKALAAMAQRIEMLNQPAARVKVVA